MPPGCKPGSPRPSDNEAGASEAAAGQVGRPRQPNSRPSRRKVSVDSSTRIMSVSAIAAVKLERVAARSVPSGSEDPRRAGLTRVQSWASRTAPGTAPDAGSRGPVEVVPEFKV